MPSGRRAARPRSLLVDREPELARLARCAERVRSGSPVSVRVVGEAGMGKTVLVRRFARALRDFHVSHAVCDAPASASPSDDIGHQLLACFGRGGGGGNARLVEVVGEALRSRPVLLVVDGVHWAQPRSMAEFDGLRQVFGECALLTVTTERPFPAVARSAGAGEVVVHLGPLTASQVRELSSRAGAGALAGVVADEVYRRAGGHPHYTTTLLTDVDPETLADRAAVVAPPTLVRLVRPLVDALPADSRELLYAMAVLREDVPRAVAARVAGVADEAAVWSPLEAAGLVRTPGGNGSDLVGPRYRVVRDAVYGMLPPTRGRALHAAAAEVVEVGTAWSHRVAAANGRKPELADELDAAGALAIARGDPHRAAEYHLWAAGLTADPDTSERRLLSAAEYFLLDADHRRARTLCARVEACAPSPRRGLVLAMLSSAPSVREQHLLDGLTAAGEGDVAARLTAALARVRLEQGRGGDAAGLAERALVDGRLGHLWRDQTRRVLVRATLSEHGSRAAGEQLLRWRSAQAVHGAPTEPVLVGTGAVRLATGRLGEAVAAFRAALAAPVRVVGTAARLECAALLAHAEYLSGDWEAADGTVSRVLGEALARDAVHVLARCAAAAAQLAAGRGRWEQAEEHLRAAEDAARRRESRSDAGFVATAAAALAQARGDHPRMLSVCERETGSEEQRWYRRVLCAEALIGTRRLGEAARAVAELRSAATDAPALHLPAHWLSGWLAAESGDLAGARARFEEGLAGAESGDGSGDVPALVLGRVEQSLARIEHRARRSRRAVELAVRAMARFAAIGAVPFLERCAADLAAYRPDPRSRRRVAHRWRDLLTAREFAVAELVAKGMTNDETAAHLRITRKTVEYHLSHVYAKLAVTSRRELRRRHGSDEA